jgi:hypothetical protein
MEEEIEKKPKRKRKEKSVPEEVPTVSDGNIIDDDNIEEVQPIEIENLENLLAPEVIASENSQLENVGNNMSLTIPDDKMGHRKISMQCNSCFIADNCPQFKEDSPCTIEWSRLFKGEFTPTDLVQSSVAVLDLQLLRINRAATFEAVNTGLLDPELTRNISLYFEMMKMFKDLSERPSPSISITAKGDATKGGGVLSQLLGLK